MSASPLLNDLSNCTDAELAQGLKTLQQQNKQISRQIGQAKAAGEALDALLAQNQQLSVQVKQIKAEQKQRKAQAQQSQTKKSQAEPNHWQEPRFHRLAEHSSFALSEVRLVKADDALAPRWDAYVQQHPQASIYHLYTWRQLIERCFGHQTLYYAAERDGQLVGLLPAVRLKSRLFGDYLVSMPYFNYGGPIADSLAIVEFLTEGLVREATALGVSHLEMRDTWPRADWPVKTDKVSMIKRLPQDSQALEASLRTKLRAQIKRPLQENPEVCWGGAELLEDFYRVFARNMRDLGTPVYAKAFFAHILAAFPQQARLVLIRMHGQPVAAAFLLGFKHTLEIPWASTLKEFNPLGVNMLMYWEVLRYAVEQGYEYFDFGRSSTDSGTYRFKQQWGAKPHGFYWHYWLAEGGELPALNPNNPKYALAIRLWKQLPVGLTQLLGPPLVKNLP